MSEHGVTPEPPTGSEHYREGWRDGYSQAAVEWLRTQDLDPVDWPARFSAAADAAENAGWGVAAGALAVVNSELTDMPPDVVEAIGRALLGKTEHGR